MFTLNKTISYTKSTQKTWYIALILGALVPLLLMTLEPFDNHQSFNYKYWILSGYLLCIAVPILLIHPIENFIYKKQNQRWYIANEIVYLLITTFFILLNCFLYHFYFISKLDSIDFQHIIGFMKTFGLPFIPIVVPLWIYLRSKYGIIKINPKTEVNAPQKLTIRGSNQDETLTINESDFVYAMSQQNYVDIFYNTENGILHQTLRSTLSNIAKQVPNAWQVHRSYLVNLDYLDSIEGNSRKRYIILTLANQKIPISQTYYKALESYLADSSQ